MNELVIKNLSVNIGSKTIINDINLKIKTGEIHVIMGPNGSGKTTLAKAIMGYKKLNIKGKIILDNKNITNFTTDKKAKIGLFLQFQNPIEIKNIKFINFIYNFYSSIYETENIENIDKDIENNLKKLNIKRDVMERDLNFGLSGGEKKKMELLQMLILNPKFAFLDEPDSGLDVDAIKIIADIIKDVIKTKKIGIVLITHYNKIISYIRPDFVHVLVNGKIVKSGTGNIAKDIEKNGFEKYIKNNV